MVVCFDVFVEGFVGDIYVLEYFVVGGVLVIEVIFE